LNSSDSQPVYLLSNPFLKQDGIPEQPEEELKDDQDMIDHYKQQLSTRKFTLFQTTFQVGGIGGFIKFNED
jgi:hypothetical protein